MQFFTGGWVSACIALSLFIDWVTGRSASLSTFGFYVAIGGAILGFILYRRSKERIFPTPYMPSALALIFLGLMLGFQAHGSAYQMAFAVVALFGGLIAVMFAENARATGRRK